MSIPTFNERVAGYQRRSRSLFAPLFKLAARFSKFRPVAIRGICRIEGGQIWSATFRELLLKYYHVNVGQYSYGPCLFPNGLPPQTVVGNYCSMASGIKVFRRNHPIERISQHPLFYNKNVGLLKEDNIPAIADNALTIGHDVWIGVNVIINPGCKIIGHGAVIASGAVVTSDIPNFAIYGGVPARFLNWRFSADQQQIWLKSCWWEKPVDKLAPHLAMYHLPFDSEMALKIASEQ